MRKGRVYQVCTNLRRDFVALIIKVSWKLEVQLPPQMFYGIKVWRLARPLHGLNVLLLEPLLFLPCPCVLGHCPAGIPIHDPSSVFWLREGGSHLIFDGILPRPLAPQCGEVVLYP